MDHTLLFELPFSLLSLSILYFQLVHVARMCFFFNVRVFRFQARLFDEPQLASLCLENIDKNTGDALAAEGFTDIDLGNVAL